jgi:integrase
MRHAYATLSLAATLPLEFVSRQLRHTPLEMTREHYARWLRPTATHWLTVAKQLHHRGAGWHESATGSPQRALILKLP